MSASSQQIGTVSVDTAEIAIVNAMYMLTDDDHNAGRTAAEVVPGYDGALAAVQADGVYPVFVHYDRGGSPLRTRIELTST